MVKIYQYCIPVRLFGQSEVPDLNDVVVRKEDVSTGQVAMKNPTTREVVHSVSYLFCPENDYFLKGGPFFWETTVFITSYINVDPFL